MHGPVTLDDRVKVNGPDQSLSCPTRPQRQKADAVILLLFYLFVQYTFNVITPLLIKLFY